MEKGGKRENKMQEGTYRHAFPSKGCRETERTEREVSVTPRETRQRTPDGARGTPTARASKPKAGKGFGARLNQPKRSLKTKRHMELPHSVLAGVGKLMRSSHQAEHLEELRNLPNLPRICPRGHQTTQTMQRGAG